MSYKPSTFLLCLSLIERTATGTVGCKVLRLFLSALAHKEPVSKSHVMSCQIRLPRKRNLPVAAELKLPALGTVDPHTQPISR